MKGLETLAVVVLIGMLGVFFLGSPNSVTQADATDFSQAIAEGLTAAAAAQVQLTDPVIPQSSGATVIPVGTIGKKASYSIFNAGEAAVPDTITETASEKGSLVCENGVCKVTKTVTTTAGVVAGGPLRRTFYYVGRNRFGDSRAVWRPVRAWRAWRGR